MRSISSLVGMPCPGFVLTYISTLTPLSSASSRSFIKSRVGPMEGGLNMYSDMSMDSSAPSSNSMIAGSYALSDMSFTLAGKNHRSDQRRTQVNIEREL